jgi:PAS domain S-box-containing protein
MHSANAALVNRHVRTIYAVRVAAFLWCLMAIGLHLWERDLGPVYWVAAVLHFLIYPHLVYRRAARAARQWPTEMQHVYADALLLGVWVAVLDFPLWIAYPLMFAPALNAIVNRGLPGFAWSMVASCTGLLAGVALHGFHYWPATSPVVTMLCVLGSLAYSAGVGLLVYQQTDRLAAARRTLLESERRYRLIAEHAGDLVAMVDRTGRWLYASPSYARIFRDEDITLGADAFRNLHEEDQFRVRGAVQVVVRSGEPCRLRMRLHTSSGGVRRFESTVHPVKDENGDIGGAVIASRDVTELRDREEQLEVAAHAFERMAEAMVITNGSGRILTVNLSYTRITGYAAEEVLGRQESEFRTAMQPQSFYDDIYAEVLRTGHWNGTTWCRRRDGTVYREWRSMSAVRDPDGRVTHFVALFRELDSHGGLQERPAKSA